MRRHLYELSHHLGFLAWEVAPNFSFYLRMCRAALQDLDRVAVPKGFARLLE